MKTMKKFLSMAALAMVGAMTVGCTSEDNVIDQAQTATKNNVVTQTVTVGLGEQAATRDLAIDYTNKKLTKTFKAGDKIAVVYQNTSDELVKVETTALTDADITAEGKSAKFTVTMTNPKASGTLKYIYPAAMAGATDVDYSKLNSQDGKLTSLASNLDLATFEGTLTAAKELPASASLENKLAILALTIKNSDGTSPLTGINKMILSDGTNSYSITGKDTDGHIYAAIQATSGANISCFATDGTNNYAKSLTGKDYQADNIYNLGLKMDAATTVTLATVTANTEVGNCSILSGTLGSNVKITIADGATVLLKDADINSGGTLSGDYAGITCVGNATIILEGENTVKGFNASYPGIYVPEGKTLTIMGTGTLKASSGVDGDGFMWGAGIGGGDASDYKNCGNIVIKGGTINATGGDVDGGMGAGIGGSGGTCGNITISGGNVTAKGGDFSAGIGGGYRTCGDITISGGTVDATGGGYQAGGAGIGSGAYQSCGNITISGGTVKAKGGTDSYNDAPGAGIGGGIINQPCGVITITTGVTSVTATKGGGDGAESIGAGKYGTAISVTIEDGANVTKN